MAYVDRIIVIVHRHPHLHAISPVHIGLVFCCLPAGPSGYTSGALVHDYILRSLLNRGPSLNGFMIAVFEVRVLYADSICTGVGVCSILPIAFPLFGFRLSVILVSGCCVGTLIIVPTCIALHKNKYLRVSFFLSFDLWVKGRASLGQYNPVGDREFARLWA